MKRKKISYFPGLISAAIIPLLFWYFGNRKFNEINIFAKSIRLPAKIEKDSSNLSMTFEPFRDWNYNKIIVSPGKAFENQNYYVSELKKIQQNNKKETGIEFSLSDQNNLQDIITVLDALEISKQEMYGFDAEKTYHIFAPHLYIDPNAEKIDDFLICGTQNFFEESEGQSNFYKEVSSQFQKLPKEGLILFFSFLIFLNLSMFSIKERFQTF
ncbi:hypothetical protein ASG31_10870 [Chryseobacterium sp. Leaf404]|uniref:hypothetical protein n=1 Tax=unclassified Chryseobacterium TaxID=2593645 RepID=UPI0006F75C12|nr:MULTISPECIES: hypothetical protein [unclassified Chryseobacterium]KQT16869.1 hypothetical protein ASG31_10870 [Chryseobacterium sp. Leaf404]